jgi:hypothetical protein
VSTRFLDPAGGRYGIPTFPWRCAPRGLATRKQLARLGLRPVGDPVAQLMWKGRPGRRARGTGCRTAALYRVASAVPRRPASPAQLVQLEAARARKRVCPTCKSDVGYVIPRRLGECLDCDETWRAAA